MKTLIALAAAFAFTFTAKAQSQVINTNAPLHTDSMVYTTPSNPQDSGYDPRTQVAPTHTPDSELPTGIISTKGPSINFKLYLNSLLNELTFEPTGWCPPCKIGVYDMSGRKVTDKIINNGVGNMPMNGNAPGVYIAVVQGMDGAVLDTRKVVVR